MSHEQEPQPRVWIGTKKAYEEGYLHGNWMEADTSPLDFDIEVNSLINTSPVENDNEYVIGATDGLYDIHVPTDTGLETVRRLTHAIRQHGEPLVVWVKRGGDIATALESFDGSFLGVFDDPFTISRHILREMGVIDSINDAMERHPEQLRDYIYIDYKQLIEDLMESGRLIVYKSKHGLYAYLP
jgi:hypothetical protein